MGILCITITQFFLVNLNYPEIQFCFILLFVFFFNKIATEMRIWWCGGWHEETSKISIVHHSNRKAVSLGQTRSQELRGELGLLTYSSPESRTNEPSHRALRWGIAERGTTGQRKPGSVWCTQRSEWDQESGIWEDAEEKWEQGRQQPEQWVAGDKGGVWSAQVGHSMVTWLLFEQHKHLAITQVTKDLKVGPDMTA